MLTDRNSVECDRRDEGGIDGETFARPLNSQAATTRLAEKVEDLKEELRNFRRGEHVTRRSESTREDQ
jgi:hypothetical protein